MQVVYEVLLYVSISAGMALTTSCFSAIGSMFGMASTLPILIAIGVAGIACVLISMSVAELASMYPSAPGVRTYLKMAFGDYASLTLVTLYLMMAATIGGVEAYVLGLVVTDMGLDVTPLAAALGSLSLILVINLLGIEVPRVAQLLMAATLVLGILAIVAVPLLGTSMPMTLPSAPTSERPDDALAFFSIIALGVFLFMGFEWVTPSGRGPHAYRWMIPLSMPIAIIVLGAIYLCFSFAIGSVLAPRDLVGNAVPQLALGRLVLGPWGHTLMACLTFLTALASFNAGIMGASRMVYALAREGSLPRWCAHKAGASGAPVGALLLIAVFALIATVIIVTSRAYLVASIVGVAIECIVYGALMFAVLRLRALQPKVARPFRNRLPAFIQGALGLAFPAIGLCALVSESAVQSKTSTVFIMLTAASLLAAAFMRARYSRRNLSLRSPFPPRPAEGPP